MKKRKKRTRSSKPKLLSEVLVGRLERYRKKHDLSQEVLAHRLGFTLMAVNNWFMKRHRPGRRARMRIGELVSQDRKSSHNKSKK